MCRILSFNFEIFIVSRIGKKKIIIKEGVDINLTDNIITVKGEKGELSYAIRDEIDVIIKDKNIIVSIKDNIKDLRINANAFWGLTRTLIFNMIEGVTVGYEKKLELRGVGYKVFLDGKQLKIEAGYSHPVFVPETKGISFKIEKNIITVSGINKELVGQVSANIRKIRKPEPYKGKGIRYVDEIVKLKQGKKTI